MMVYVLLGLFSLSLVLVGGKKGAASLYALVFTFICVICMYVPLLYAGLNGVLAALITSIVILAASIYILNGFHQNYMRYNRNINWDYNIWRACNDCRKYVTFEWL